MTQVQRVYCAIIWDPVSDELAEKLTEQEIRVLAHYRYGWESTYEEFLAYDLYDAKSKLVAKYGLKKSFSIWNEEDRNKPR